MLKLKIWILILFYLIKKEFYSFGLWLSMWKNLSILPLKSKWSISIISRIKQNIEFFSVIHENEISFPGISPWNNFFHSNVEKCVSDYLKRNIFLKLIHKRRKFIHKLILSKRFLHTIKCTSMQANVRILWLFQHKFITKKCETNHLRGGENI